MRISFMFVAALLSAHPEGARVKDKDGRLPLHFACINNAPREAVAALLSAFPDGAREVDRRGRLPFHDAFSSDTRALLSASFPDAAAVPAPR